jgi:hypothetical protein
VLLIALWVRSYWRTNGLYWNVYHHRSVIVGSIEGQIVVYSDLMTIGRPRLMLLNGRHLGMGPILWIASGNPSRGRGGMGPFGHHVLFPHWAALLVVGSTSVFCSRYPFRYSLRALLIVTTLVAVG